jgi:hypothetical protein
MMTEAVSDGKAVAIRWSTQPKRGGRSGPYLAFLPDRMMMVWPGVFGRQQSCTGPDPRAVSNACPTALATADPAQDFPVEKALALRIL